MAPCAFAATGLALRVRTPTYALPATHSCRAPKRGVVFAKATRPKGKSSARRFDPKNPPPPPPKVKLEPEEVFYEGPPSWTDLVVPTLSILTVVGLIPFVAAAARYAWVRYKFTSRRIAIDSGFRGKDHTEIVYRDIERIRYVRRIGGCADCVLELRDGAKLEIRSIPNFDDVYNFVIDKLDDDAKKASGSV